MSQEKLTAVQKELDEALDLLHGVAVQVEKPRTDTSILANGEAVQVKKDPWVKFNVNFSRGEKSLLRRMTGGELKVFLAIALRIDERYSSFPGTDTIADDTGLHRSSVLRAIKSLEGLGIISVYRAPGLANTYTISGYMAYGKSEPDQSLFPTSSVGATRSVDATSSVEATGTRSVGATLRRTIEEEPRKNSGLPPLGIEDSYTISYYYRDKENVRAVGTVGRGPWRVECYGCGGQVDIRSLDTPSECLCGEHEYILTKNRPKAKPRERKPESVEAYYSVMKGKVRYSSLDNAWEKMIADQVKDIPRWKEVMVAYIDRGWNPFSVDRMLDYYAQQRLPGTRLSAGAGGGETDDQKFKESEN